MPEGADGYYVEGRVPRRIGVKHLGCNDSISFVVNSEVSEKLIGTRSRDIHVFNVSFSGNSGMSDKYTIALPVFDEWLSSVVAPSGPALRELALREVLPESCLSERQALEQFARYFKSEMDYDNVQYYADEHDRNCVGFLFTSSALDMCTDGNKSMPTRCMGGCCFRKITDTWVLCWVWIHPFARKKGMLKRCWNYYFLETFGDFAVEAPLSPSMESFLERQQSTHRLVRIGSE